MDIEQEARDPKDRRRIEALLHRQIPDGIWENALRDGMGEEASEHGVESVLDYFTTLLHAYDLGRQPGTVITGRPPAARTGDWSHAMSYLLADEAASRLDVQAFRKDVLRGRLVKPHRIASWIERRASAEPETYELTIAVPASLSPTRELLLRPSDLAKVGEVPVTSVHTPDLDYAEPGDKWTRSVPTGRGGVLDWLRGLSEDLARAYGWGEAQATIFVLTGLVPLVPAVKANVRLVPGLAGTSRITLEIFLGAEPEEVAKTYRGTRARLLLKRHRALSSKHLRLAAFSTRQKPEEGWGELMRRWNATYKKDQYTNRSHFARDMRVAVQRLLHPEVHAGGLFGQPKPLPSGGNSRHRGRAQGQSKERAAAKVASQPRR